jgi:hypothetical protein
MNIKGLNMNQVGELVLPDIINYFASSYFEIFGVCVFRGKFNVYVKYFRRERS